MTNTSIPIYRIPRSIGVDGVTRRVLNTAKFPDSRTFTADSRAFYLLYLDDPIMPHRPCSCHTLSGAALAHIASGRWVFTGGHKYELPKKENSNG